jgi:hypothetical protein
LAGGETDLALGRRLRVFIAGDGKHLFKRLADPRLYLYDGRPDRPPVPDLVVFPVSQPREFSELNASLPQQVRERLVVGKARILLDASGEGFGHQPAMAQALHAFVEEAGAQVGRAIYVTQNRTFREAYQAWCGSVGVPRPMSVFTYDYWIKRFFAPFESKGEALYAQRLEAFNARDRRRERRFLSLNWSPRSHKVFFLMRVMRDGLWGAGYISFGGLDQLERMGSGKHMARLHKELRLTPRFEDLFEELLPYVKKLEAKGRIQIGDLKTHPQCDAPALTDDAALPEYDRSWFSVITESEMSDQPARITEKPFKALVNFHPILVFGNPGALRMIRELGFQTFPEVFDESYDDEPDPRRRFEMVYAQFERVCRMTKRELRRQEALIADKLAFNARHGLTVLPARYRLEIDRAFVDELARLWSVSAKKPPVPAVPRLQSEPPEPAWRRLLGDR